MKSMFRCVRKAVLGLTLAVMLLPVSSFAETTQCTVIDYLPYVITEQGVYCFTDHLATSDTTGYAIEIQTNNVTIDFNGFKLGGLGGGVDSQMYGVYANARDNIVLKDANVRGFNRGVSLAGGYGHKILNSNFDGNFLYGINMTGSGLIEGNTVTNTGGASTGNVYGIVVGGPNAVVRNNIVTGVFKETAGNACGLFVSGDYATVADNIIVGGAHTNSETTGILMSGYSNFNVVEGNRVSNFDFGIVSDTGMQCNIITQICFPVFGDAVLSGNLLSVVSTSYEGNLTDAGGNFPAFP